MWKLTALLLALFALPQEPFPPPVAKRVEHVQEWHGQKFTDPYFWLRDKQSPDVAAYLYAENAYTQAMTMKLLPLRERIYAEFIGRVKQTDLSVPIRRGAYCYYERSLQGQQYPIHCRKAAKRGGAINEKAPEEVLLDPNALAQGLAYLDIGAMEVSDDDHLLAYSTDVTGFRQYALHVKDLKSGNLLPDTAERVNSVQWAEDSQILFFVTEDAVTKRSNQLWRLELGGKPELIYEEMDELFALEINRTKDRHCLVLQSKSTDTWESRVLFAYEPRGTFEVVLPREKGHKYEIVTPGYGDYLIRTNKDAPNFRLVAVRQERQLDKEDEPLPPWLKPRWKEVIPHREDVLLLSVEVFASFIVAVEQKDGLTRFRIQDLVGHGAQREWKEIAFPEEVYSAAPAGTPEFTSLDYHIHYQSPKTPSCIYEYEMTTLDRKLLKQQEVLGEFDPSHYTTERLWAPAQDGTQIPISLAYRSDAKLSAPPPLLLCAYGSYGEGTSAAFDSDRLSLLDRGVVYAIAHIRGGNELGEKWHQGGMLMKKKNSFTDFIACAEHLIAEKWTTKDRLIIQGDGAGGLLMGAVVNLRPDLFRAVHAAVPFVDVINTMMDPSLPLTVGEYLEWGNPNEKAAFDYMLSYSPYDNLTRTAYPAMLVTTSFHDSQVMYWEPAKYVAKLRSLKTDAHPLLFKCKMAPAGHGGSSGRYDQWQDKSFEYAWMLSQLGIDG